MSVDKTAATLPGYVASFSTSGNWTAPTNTNKIYVALKGSSGGNTTVGYSGGGSVIGGAYVTVAGGATYPVVIGAVGANGSASNCSTYGSVPTRYSTTIGCTAYNATTGGSTGGTTTWDSNAIVVYGGNGGTISGNGSSGAAVFETSLPQLYPTGAAARVSSTTTTNSNTGSGQAYVFIV